ncbi:hypothetical protein AAG906_001041 [Vitis piasezkii]
MLLKNSTNNTSVGSPNAIRQEDDSTGYAVREGLLWFNGKVVACNGPFQGLLACSIGQKCGNWFEILWQGVKSVKLSNHSTKHHRDYFSHFQSRVKYGILSQWILDCPLHGFPTTIISDRDPVFMSSFWQELFKLQGTTLATSSAYHPQTDGQTEVLNRCLEDYLRCFVADHPKQWLHYLLLGRFGLRDAVDALPKDRTQIRNSQRQSACTNQMRNQTNTHRTDVTFRVDDWFSQVKPYTNYMSPSPASKALQRSRMAYKLALPEDARIHNVFHVSNLKKCRGDPLEQPQIPLPARFKDSSPILQPAHVLGFRQISQLGKLCPQLLIQWEGQDPSDATWENTHEFQKISDFNLEDKVIKTRVMMQPNGQIRSKRVKPKENPKATNNKHVTRIETHQNGLRISLWPPNRDHTMSSNDEFCYVNHWQ